MEILFRNQDLAVVNKPSGLLIHRGWGRDSVTALSATRDACGQYVYPVHRLDRGTSGALLFAFSPEAARQLQADMQAGGFDKHYIALVRGVLRQATTVDRPLASAKDKPKKAAVTDVLPLGNWQSYSLVQAHPRTGRTHQIRRHLKSLSHPLIGDVRYGKGAHNRYFREEFGLHRLALHALHLSFPWDGERVSVDAPVPEDLRQPLCSMGLWPANVAGPTVGRPGESDETAPGTAAASPSLAP